MLGKRDAELAECQAEVREARMELAELRRELRALQAPRAAVPRRERLVSPALARCRAELADVQAEIAAVRREIARLTRAPEEARPAELVLRPTRAEINQAIARATAVIQAAAPTARRVDVDAAMRDAMDDILALDVRPSVTTFERTIRDRLLDRGIRVTPAVARAAATAALRELGVSPRELEVPVEAEPRRVRACPAFWTQS